MIFKILIAEILIAGVLAGLGFYLSKKKGKIDTIELVTLTITALLWSISMFAPCFLNKLASREYSNPAIAVSFSKSYIAYACIFGGVLFFSVFSYLSVLTVKHFMNPRKKYESFFTAVPANTLAKKNFISGAAISLAILGVSILIFPLSENIDLSIVAHCFIVTLIMILLLRWRRTVRAERDTPDKETIPVTSWRKLSLAVIISLAVIYFKLHSYFVENQNKYELIYNGLGVLQFLSISVLLTVATARLYRKKAG